MKSLELEPLAAIKDKALMLEDRNREWKGNNAHPWEKGSSS